MYIDPPSRSEEFYQLQSTGSKIMLIFNATTLEPGMHIVPFIIKNFPFFLIFSPNSFIFLPFILFIPFSIPFSSLFSSLFLLSLPLFFFSLLYILKTFPNDLKKIPPLGRGNTEQYTSLT